MWRYARCSKWWSKKQRAPKFFLIASVFVFCTMSFTASAQKADSLLLKMLDACDRLKTARYVLYKTEKLKTGGTMNSELIVKLNVNPFKVYVYSIKPNPAAEAMFRAGENKNEVLVHPNRFPYMNLSLAPDNFLLREHQHHSIRELGFTYVAGLLRRSLPLSPNARVTLDGETEFDHRQCYILSVENPDFILKDYYVQKGEDIIAIARKLGLSEYMILCYNKGMKEYNDVRPGQRIKIPSSYARKINLYVDKITLLPLMQAVYDDKDLFERYEYHSFVVNPLFKPEEFTPKFQGYGF